MKKTITVLSVRQPWAYLIVAGLKDVENRTWKTNYRGELYIHAGKAFDWDALPFIQANHVDVWQTIAQQFHLLGWVIPRREITNSMRGQLGAIIGRVNLIDCGRSKSIWAQPEVAYHWQVGNAQSIVPIPMRGQLGLFQIPHPPLIETEYFEETIR